MSKIYLAVPAGSFSGGAESLYQLGEELINKGKEVYLFYYSGKRNTIPEKFKQYSIPITDKIDDSSNNAIVVPETQTTLLKEYSEIKKYIWWLSVDFYLAKTLPGAVESSLKKKGLSNIYKPLMYLWYYLKIGKSKNFKNFDFSQSKVMHLFNCYYVKEFLLNKGVSEKQLLFLAPPVSDEYFSLEKKEKKNIVAYNPAKGLEFTEKVIEYLSENRKDICFKAIKNMTSEDVAELLNESKVYIDLGFFPGPDRIPRQAALADCAVITSKIGSAGNAIDTPIDGKYKFDRNDVVGIGNSIIDNIDNYQKNIHDFQEFRQRVIFEKDNFTNEINNLVDSFQ